MAGSPVIDAAYAAAWMAGDRDLAGNPRIHGAAPDMGAFEAADANAGALAVNFVGDTLTGHDSLAVTFTAFPSGSDTDGLIYVWDFNNDGTPDTVGPDKGEVTWVFPTGRFTVRLSVTNGTQESAEAIKENYIFVSPSLIYVAANGSGYPGTSWGDAFTNVQDALNFAIGSNTIFLAGQTFDLDNELIWASLDNVQMIGGHQALPETVGRGAHDMDRWPTTLRRTPSQSRVMSVSLSTRSRLACVTVTGGYPPTSGLKSYGGGLNVFKSELDITDCAFTNNQIYASGNGQSWGGGVYADGSTVTIRRSLFAHNRATSGGNVNNNRSMGGAVATENSTIHILESRFINNDAYATGHYGSWGGAIYLNDGDNLIRNSLFVGNRAGITRNNSEGGAIFLKAGTIIESCTFVNNSCYGDQAVSYTYHGAGGVYNNGGFITNSLFWANSNTYHNTVADIGTNSQARIAWSRAAELTDGENGNTDDDPLLVMTPAGRHPQYSLTDGSPCINAGIRLPWMEAATDLAGNKRVSGGGVDIGCYEKPAASATILMLR